MSRNNKCCDCEWRRVVHGGYVMECHRFPPVPVVITVGQNAGQLTYAWSCVQPDDYCGEWRSL